MISTRQLSSMMRLHSSLGTATMLLIAGLSVSVQAQVQAPSGQAAYPRGPRGVISPTGQPANPAPARIQAPAQSPPTPLATTQTPASTATAVTAKPLSMLEQPPTQAVIQTDANNLTIRANNASLTQTLQRIADKTGMHFEGMNGDQRVFGDFGPGAPRDVLNTLLNGTGYNIVMVGALDNGAPRELILSQKKSTTPSAPATPQQPQQNNGDDDSVDSPPDDQPAMQQGMPPRGADVPNGARTPQQMLQQLQQMRQQNEQQNNVPPPQ